MEKQKITVEEWMKSRNAIRSSSKYRNTRQEYTASAGHTRTYDSLAEKGYAEKLDLLLRAGEILSWVPQVRFDLPGGIRHYVDFMILRPLTALDEAGGVRTELSVEFIEVKGFDKREGKNKRRQVEAIYGIQIKVVRG